MVGSMLACLVTNESKAEEHARPKIIRGRKKEREKREVENSSNSFLEGGLKECREREVQKKRKRKVISIPVKKCNGHSCCSHIQDLSGKRAYLTDLGTYGRI